MGGLLGAYATQGKFQSVPDILKAMDHEHRNQLHQHFRNTITGFDLQDFVALNALVMGNEIVRMQALNGLKDFFGTVMKMEVVD